MRRLSLRLLPAALGIALLAGCTEGDDPVVPPVAGPAGELFNRYVALGNSITAGFQSAGINDSTQLQAYPVLLAQRAGAPFVAPLLARPGCPPPFAVPLGPQRVGGPTAGPCALRAPMLPGAVQNLAVPGADIRSPLHAITSTDPTTSFNRLQFFVLGGRSMLESAQRQNPTLVSVWLGNNDVLGAALSGQTAALTSTARFNAATDTLMAGISAIPTLKDAIVMGVVNVNAIPLLQPGVYFYLSRDAQGLFSGKRVNANCAPVNQLGQPNPMSFNLVSFQMVGAFPEINCSNSYTPNPAAIPPGTFVLDAAEQVAIATRAAEFNAKLQSVATANGWIYLDPNTLLQQFGNQRDPQGRFQFLRKCQALTPQVLASGNVQAIQGAIVTSCPVPPVGPTAPFAAPNFFGSLISFDGFHPAATAHRLIADALAAAINAKHGLTLPTS